MTGYAKGYLSLTFCFLFLQQSAAGYDSPERVRPLAELILDKTPAGYLFDNFHKVERNQCYRSKQLSPAALEHYIKKYEIKTILNLRGVHHDEQWWHQEATIASKYNIAFINVGLSSQRMPSSKAVESILYAFKHAPKPLLIHCYQGCDRTGLVSALWKMEQMNMPYKNAKRQCTFFPYCHIRSARPNMRRFLTIWSNLRAMHGPDEALDLYRRHYEEQVNLSNLFFDDPFTYTERYLI